MSPSSVGPSSTMAGQAVDASSSKRAAQGLAGPLVAGIAVVVGTFAVGEQTSWRFTGSGADMGNHYALAYWFAHNWTMPGADDLTVGIIARNPPAANIAAALVGRVAGSTFMGLYVVATAALVLVWCALAALLALLPAPRRWIALGGLTVLLALNTSAGPLRLDVHGFEIVINFFFAQIAAQAVVWWLVWFAVRRRLKGRSAISTAVPIAVVAVVSTYIHALAAVELLALVGCLATTEAVVRWRNGRRDIRSLAAPPGLFVAAVAATAVMPPFRAQSGFARNDGYLEVDYLSWPFGYVMVALAVVAVSATFLFSSTRGLDRSTAGVLQGLAFAGIAIAAPFFAQLASLAADQGSPYAVKKYAFGLITLLAMDLCVVIACLVPVSARRPRSQAALTYVVGVALVVVATYGTFSQPGAGYFTTTIVDLEGSVETVASSGDLGSDRRDYAIGLAGSDLWLDFMFSTAILRPHDVRPLYRLLRGRDARLSMSADQIVTEVGSPYDLADCRDSAPAGGLVIVHAGGC